MQGPHTIHVLLDGGWIIQFRDERFGPYPSREDAVSTAEMWANNARQQGHTVNLLIGLEKMPATGAPLA